MLHPISFSIPLSKITDSVKPKRKTVAHVIPGTHRNKEARKTHIFKDEKPYYEDYQMSLFGLTIKKAGWDCMRHYEILANGCIPAFVGLKECPPRTMVAFPKELTMEGTRLYHELKDRAFEELTAVEIQSCINLSAKLLEYTRQHLTTTAEARRMLTALGGQCKRVLVLSGSTTPDYLRDLTLHGLKTILGKNCHDYPCIRFLYNVPQKVRGLYGRGFTYTQILDPCHRDDARDATVEQDISAHRYDTIIYGSYHRGMPMLDLVLKHYRPQDVVLICGEDMNCVRRGCVPGDHETWVSRGHHVFVRELQ